MLDRYLPGVPAVSPTNSRRGFERARKLGVEGDYTLIRGRSTESPFAPRWSDRFRGPVALELHCTFRAARQREDAPRSPWSRAYCRFG